MASSATTNRFDRWASSYEDNTLQQYLFVPVHQTTLQLALKLLPHPRRILEIGRVLTPDGVLLLADVFPSSPRPGPALPRRRRRHPVMPAELGPVLAAHRMTVIGHDHTPWFRLPDVQVIAARQQPQGAVSTSGSGS